MSSALQLTRRAALSALLGLSASAGVARAQRPPGADTISQRAVAESLAVLDRLAEQIKHDKGNAALWYRQGMIAWALYDRDRASGGVDRVDWTRIGRLADTSLRIAKSLEPDNPRYILGAGQYFLGTGLLTMRAQSYGMFGDALVIARTGADAAVHAEAALEVGRVYWRRYDAVANAGYSTADAAEVRVLAQLLSKDTANHARAIDPERTSKSRPYTRRTVATARQALDKGAPKPLSGFPGEADYLTADKYIREAYETLRSYGRAYQQMGMLLAERSRWTELESLARAHLDLLPRDAWTWMTLGLATYRAGDTHTAREAFANGLRYFSEFERERLDHLERVLRPSDTLSSASWTPDERAENGELYWRAADPLWSVDDIDPRVEFLARIAYAELRWTVDELAKHGTDTDRGRVYVRYGPPDRIASNDGKSEWTYDFSQLHFRFTSAPTFGTAYFADYGRVHDLVDSLPATWDNTHLMQIDTIPVQVARFRAAGDSLDVLFATRAPVEGIRRATDVAGPVRSDLWLLDSEKLIVRHDSTRNTPAAPSMTTRRLATGTYEFRVEASALASLAAGRSTGAIDVSADSGTGVSTSGFGISDMVLASRVGARTTPARRWTDVDMTPALGALAARSQLSLVWENYDFGVRDGAASYRVSVTVQRERTRVGRIATQLVGAFAGAAKRDASLDRVQMSVERTAPAAVIMPDQITVALGATPAGSYVLTLGVVDLITGKTASRTMRIVIGDQ